MRLTTAGNPYGFSAPVVGAITKSLEDQSRASRGAKIYVGSLSNRFAEMEGYRAVVSTEGEARAKEVFRETHVPVVYSVRHEDHFREGDVLAINPSNGFIRTVYRSDSAHNILFMTERCNSNCLMCSQPPKDVDDTDQLYQTNIEIIKYISPSTSYLTITGGEPTLLGNRLFSLLTRLNSDLPQTHLHMLTNGRLFAWKEYARSLASVRHPKLTLGIPLYSDYARDHDHIVQAKGAFDQTVLGLHQLARWQISTEIRIVLHKLSVPRLANLAEFIVRNLPFASHVALMGLEPTGYTPRNKEQLWIDPTDYQEELEQAVETLIFGRLVVSIYNTPLCLLKPNLWPYAKRSISDWKNIFLPQCRHCGVLEQCGGLFQSGERIHSIHIHSLPTRPDRICPSDSSLHARAT